MRAASTVTKMLRGGPSPLGPAHHLMPSAPAVNAIRTVANASAARFQRSDGSANGSHGSAPNTLRTPSAGQQHGDDAMLYERRRTGAHAADDAHANFVSVQQQSLPDVVSV
jgi:hypothetical protein